MENAQIGEENKEKGEKAEKLFEDYLNNKNIPYYHIDQKPETYSVEFSHNNIHRPDYKIYIKNNIYYIDVKFRKKIKFVNNEKRFYLNQDEIITLYNFQNKLNANVWVSFIDNVTIQQFYYAPIIEINEYYKNIMDIIKEGFFKDLKNDFPVEGDEVIACFENRFIYIPENILFENLSLDKGFHKKTNIEYYRIEGKYHTGKWIDELRYESFSNKLKKYTL
jgi:hypothetical protein